MYPTPTTREYRSNTKRLPSDIGWGHPHFEELSRTSNKPHETIGRLKKNQFWIWSGWLGVFSPSTVQTNFTKNSKIHKLSPNFYVPYKVQKWVGQVAYALDIPNKGKIRDVFHVSFLKKNLGSATHIQIEFCMLDDDEELVLELDCILEIKTIKFHSRRVNEYLMKWKTYQMMRVHGRTNILVHATDP